MQRVFLFKLNKSAAKVIMSMLYEVLKPSEPLNAKLYSEQLQKVNTKLAKYSHTLNIGCEKSHSCTTTLVHVLAVETKLRNLELEIPPTYPSLYTYRTLAPV